MTARWEHEDWMEREGIQPGCWRPLHFDPPLRPFSTPPWALLPEAARREVVALLAPDRRLPEVTGSDAGEVRAAIRTLAAELVAWRHLKDDQRPAITYALAMLRRAWLAVLAGRADLCRYQFEAAKGAWLRAAIAPALNQSARRHLAHMSRVLEGKRTQSKRLPIAAAIDAAIKASPGASSDKIARALGVSASTVLRRRRGRM